jgi:guanylate kinase
MIERGTLFVISAPSGGGKGTLIRRVLSEVAHLGYSVSFTTRLPRPGEVHGQDYFFVERAEFEKMVAAGGFIEWAEVHGRLYGTARAQVERELAAGQDIIVEIDVQGAAQMRGLAVDAVSIFILPPSFAVLRQRLTSRGTEDAAQLALRLRNAQREVLDYQHFDYVIVNDELEQATTRLAAVIIAERARRTRQTQTLTKILATFAATTELTE